MQKICEVIVCVHLYLFAHLEIMIDYQIKFSLELFLVQLRFISDECFVADICHVVELGKILILLKLILHLMFNLFKILFIECLFAQSMLEPLLIDELEFIYLMQRPALSFVINRVDNVKVSLPPYTTANSFLQVQVISAISLAFDSAKDIR